MGIESGCEGGGGLLFLPATNFTLLEYMIIWSKIQVIIYPLLSYTFLVKDLIKHVKESHDGQIFSCEICKKEFASVKIMQRHMSGIYRIFFISLQY